MTSTSRFLGDYKNKFKTNNAIKQYNEHNAGMKDKRLLAFVHVCC